MLASVYTWIKKNNFLMESFRDFVTDIKIDAQKAPRNGGSVEETIMHIQKLDLFGAIRSFSTAVGFNADRTEDVINILQEDLAIIDRIILIILKELTKHLNYVLLNGKEMVRLVNLKRYIDPIKHLLGALKIDYDSLYELLLCVENQETHKALELLVAVFQFAPWMEKFENLQSIEQNFQRKQFEPMMEKLTKLFPIDKSDLEKLFEDFGKIMQIIEEEQVPNKLEEFVVPMIPEKETFQGGVMRLFEKVRPTVNGQFWKFLGVKQLEFSNLESAKGSLEQAKALLPEDSDVLNLLGLTHFNLNDFDKALENFDKALEINDSVAEYYNHKGLILALKGDEDGSKKNYEKALSLESNNSSLLIMRMRPLICQKKLDKALEILEKAVEIGPKIWVNWMLKGTCLVLMDQNEKAIKDLERAIELTPLENETDSPFYFLVNGQMSYAKGLYKKALWEYTQFANKQLSLGSSKFIALAEIFRGFAYEKTDQIKLARKSYKSALKFKPESLWIKEGLERIGEEEK
ncbi:tetratricopeptide repeat protein [Anaeramoeba flamelloides]|uniref:Tetratricopeptide repeat protein n=1 Tax=Anaeramoeba flamelloides TaxID=1746091 RepID=A0AAV8A1A4_9EUKA|nr:tetratricopeptide repeat protein [Anaeramoeba flamelloides]